MWNLPLLPLIAGLGLGAAAMVARGQWLARQRRRDDRRRTLVASLARQQGFKLLDETPEHLLERVRWVDGVRRNARVKDVLLGKDDQGTYYVGRREARGLAQQVLSFESNASICLQGFRLDLLPAENRSAARRWADTVLRRDDDEWRLQVCWDGDSAQMADAATVAMGGAVLRTMARMIEGGTRLGLSVHDRQVEVHTTRSVSDDGMSDLLEVLKMVRQELLSVLRETSMARPTQRIPSIRPNDATATSQTWRKPMPSELSRANSVAATTEASMNGMPGVGLHPSRVDTATSRTDSGLARAVRHGHKDLRSALAQEGNIERLPMPTTLAPDDVATRTETVRAASRGVPPTQVDRRGPVTREIDRVEQIVHSALDEVDDLPVAEAKPVGLRPARLKPAESEPLAAGDRTMGDSRGWSVRGGKKVFEIPEPEEKVVLVSGHSRY